jgi:hypothetical protein
MAGALELAVSRGGWETLTVVVAVQPLPVSLTVKV